MGKIWANSGDSHFVEPENLFEERLPKDLAERMPRSVKDADGLWETVYVDGQEFRRRMPKMDGEQGEIELTAEEFKDKDRRPPGYMNIPLRLEDLDLEGIWAELTFPSLGIWSFNIRDPKLALAGSMALNDWAVEMQNKSPRFVCTAALPLIDIDDAIKEAKRTAALGLKAVSLPARPGLSNGKTPSYTDEFFDPLWDVLDDLGTRVAFHIGTEPHTPDVRTGVLHTGRGGAVMNYTETTFGGQRVACQMVASGALDKRPNLKVIVSEGGSGWVPFMADRLDEAYRQHSAAVRPKLSRLPGEILYEQVYASFQHDYRSSTTAYTAQGYKNGMFGSDYPHWEGTFGHTQKTLHELCDDIAPEVSHRIRIGAFAELFPHVPTPPADEA
jgi:predicted TIM-barrel fold metal-dependent hydrolase